jgi:hypothetical protein
MAWNRWVGTGAAVVVLVVAGCSSAKSNNSATSPGNTTATTAATTGGGSSGGSGGSETQQLAALQTKVQSLKNVTFKATYTGTDTSGKQTTVTFEQKPPKFTLSFNGEGSVIDNGTTSYFCSTSTGASSCLASGVSGNPFASILGLYNGSTLLPLLQQWNTQVAAKQAGATVTFSDQTFAGQASKCVNYSFQSQSAKWCLTDLGLAA